MKQIYGFEIIHAHDLTVNQFFFFRNGKKRMVAEEVKTDCGLTTIKATNPSGRMITKTVYGCSKIYVYK